MIWKDEVSDDDAAEGEAGFVGQECAAFLSHHFEDGSGGDGGIVGGVRERGGKGRGEVFEVG